MLNQHDFYTAMPITSNTLLTIQILHCKKRKGKMCTIFSNSFSSLPSYSPAKNINNLIGEQSSVDLPSSQEGKK